MNVSTSDIQNPYLLYRGTSKTYEYSAYVSPLGASYVDQVVETIRKAQAGISMNHWKATYLYPASLLFEGLKDLIDSRSIQLPKGMTAEDGRDLVRRLDADIDQNASSKIFKRRIRTLLALLEKSGLMPAGWDVPAEDPEVDNALFLYKTHRRHNAYITYEYSKFASTVGHDFVVAACATIRGAKHTAGVTVKTWLDNYVVRLGQFFELLETFLLDNKLLSAEKMDIATWERFSHWMEREVFKDRIVKRFARPMTLSTKEKHRTLLNNLIRMLAASKVIPKRFEIASPAGRSKSADGTSIFTRRGWSKKEQQEEMLSPFSFRIEKFTSRQAPFSFDKFQPLARVFLLDAIPIIEKAFFIWGAEKSEEIYYSFTNLLLFFQSQKEKELHPEFFARLATKAYRDIDDLTWEKMLYEWRDYILHHSLENGRETDLLTKHNIVIRSNRLLIELAENNIVPEVKIKGFPGAKARSGKKSRTSLAQLSTANDSHLLRKKQEKATAKLGEYFDELEKPEALEFINALCQELTSQEVRSLDIGSLISQISKLNKARLVMLRACAEKDFLRWHMHWNEGQRALKSVDLSEDEICDVLDSETRSVSARRKSSTRILGGSRSSETDPHFKYLGNCLLLAIGAHDGIISGIYGRYHHICRRYGGKDAFHAYLHPHNRARLALWVILLVDAGANCEVVRDMPFDCLHRTDDPTQMKVSFGLKARANYQRIEDHLPIEPEDGQLLSAVQAIDCYKQMSARYRGLADDCTKGFLFLHEREGKITNYSEFGARENFISFLADHPELAGLDARPSFIRPSYLLQRQHDDPQARLEVAQAAGDHASPSSTQLYTGKTHTKLIYQKKIREFQSLFQAVIISSIEGAAEKLAISQSEAQHLFSEAARSGLGVACLNSKAGLQLGTKRGEDCTRLDACPGCDMRYLVGTVDNIADLILFEEYLQANEEQMMQKSALVWEQRWLPWLVLAEIALANFKQGETASMYVRAKANADLRRPTYKGFPLH